MPSINSERITMSKTPVGQSEKIGNIEVRNLGMGPTCPPLIGLGDCKVYVGCHTATIDAFGDVAWLAEQDGVVVPESLDVVEEAVSPDELDCGLSYWVALINSDHIGCAT
jgi:hypothetical protein